MPSETRSKGQPPPSRIYHSSPALQQAQFSSRRHIIRTYGRRQSAPPLRQQTLTQIDYLVPLAPDELVDDNLTPPRERKRLRRTLGDGTDEDGLGSGAVDDGDDGDDRDEGEDEAPMSSKFQTQTLTQLMEKRRERRRERCSRPVPQGVEIVLIKDSEDESNDEELEEEQEEEQEGEGKEEPAEEPAGFGDAGAVDNWIAEKNDIDNDSDENKPPTLDIKPVKYTAARLSTPHPRTPSRKTSISREIPSSQPSPGTPLLHRLSPLGPRRSPLKHKSPNIMRSQAKPLDLDDPDRRSNIPKLHAVQDSIEFIASVETPSKRRRQGFDDDLLTSSSSAKRHKSVSFEIPDSDDETEEDWEGFEPISEDEGEEVVRDHGLDTEVENRGDSPAKHVDEQEQAAEDQGTEKTIVSASLAQNATVQSPGLIMGAKISAAAVDNEFNNESLLLVQDKKEKKPHGEDADRTEVDETKVDKMKQRSNEEHDMHIDLDAGAETQILMDQLLSATERQFSRDTSSTAPPSSALAGSQSDMCIRPVRRPKVMVSPGTQMYESQRVPLSIIRSMPPTDTRSDVFISIGPRNVADIVGGLKDHEFCKYHIPECVSRFWIYETLPVGQIRYMALVSPAKAVGKIEVEREARGIGNAEFNRGEKQARWAYELLDVYLLNNPVPLEEMIEEGWLKAAPQPFKYVPPAVVGQLLGNLRESLFEEIAVTATAATTEDRGRDQQDQTHLTDDGDSDLETTTQARQDPAAVGSREVKVRVETRAVTDVVASSSRESSPCPDSQAYKIVPATLIPATLPTVPASSPDDRFKRPQLPAGRIGSPTSTDAWMGRGGRNALGTLPAIPAQLTNPARTVAATDPHTPLRRGEVLSLSQMSTASRASSTASRSGSPSPVSPSPAPRTRTQTRRSVPRPALPHSSSGIPSSLLLESEGAVEAELAESVESAGSDAVVPNSTPVRAPTAGSSQTIPTSQVLPESLMMDDGREPPEVIWDSQAEDDEGYQ